MTRPTLSSRFNYLYYIWLTVHTMKFLIVEPSALVIRFPLGAQIFASESCFQIPLACIPPFNVRGHVSQPYNTMGNIIVLL